MNYHILLTGATGLLGRYLLRDLLQMGISVATVVRPSRRQSAEERVEALMATWEEQLEATLPRPVVLSGDLGEKDLGLSDYDVQWVKEHCDSMLHNAASLTFVGSDEAGEPWKSNVNGTQNVLDLCEKTGIHDFHHVSTAYVCGLRHGRVLESEGDVGQDHGNDYERSKLSAETLVRSAGFLSPPTVYRPSIIIGDSTNGFTTTFHGFYAALRLVHTLLQSMVIEATGRTYGNPTRLTLDGTESKNLVPVDWVSAATAHIIASPEHHGRTYHLTPQHPVTTELLRDVLEASNHFYGTVFHGNGTAVSDPTLSEQLFYEHISVYDSYWRDDPVFDRKNTLAATPHMPCPHVDRDMLLRLAEVAIGMGFRWKDQSVEVPEPSELAS